MISPSGAAILAAIHPSGCAAIPEIATETRLTPGRIREDLAALEQQDWVVIDSDRMTVRLTDVGNSFYRSLAKGKLPFYQSETPRSTGDVDAALEHALEQ